MWDSILLAYADRSRIIPPDARQLVSRKNGDILPTLLVDGYVAAAWTVTRKGALEMTPLRRISKAEKAEIDEEGARLVDFVVQPDA